MEDLGRALSHLSALDSFLVLLQDADSGMKNALDLRDVSAGLSLLLQAVQKEIAGIRERLGAIECAGNGNLIGIRMEGKE